MTGSAFCIHGSGWFVTNEHVVRKQGAVVLTLNPGLHSEMRYAAQVVRTDKRLDLALLRARNARYLPVLSLGSDKGLEERMEVLAFGFPFGTALASSALGYPDVSVNAGRITAFRHKADDLYRIQVDAELNPGNSGGPVLDRYGRVIGVVVEGIPGRRVNFAIPVSAVRGSSCARGHIRAADDRAGEYPPADGVRGSGGVPGRPVGPAVGGA